MSKNFTINGKRGAHAQPGKYGLNETGFYSHTVFEGTAADIAARASAYAAINVLYEVEGLPGGRARLTYYATWANANQLGQEVPVEAWELDSQEVEKDLLDADFPHGSLTPLSSSDRATISGLINNGISWNGTTNPVELPGAGGSNESHTIDDVPNSKSFYLLMKSGVRAFPVPAHVIRHTFTVSNQYAVKASENNVDRILSTAYMNSTEGVPNDLLFNVPTKPAATQFIETSGDLQYGWRKIEPSVSNIALQRRQITQNYQFGLWAVKMYGTVL